MRISTPSGVFILFQPETLHLHHQRKYRDNAQANYLQERTAHENNKNRPESKQKLSLSHESKKSNKDDKKFTNKIL